MNLLLAAASILAGLAFGSFLNVCISRIPHDLSIVRPRSLCPHCGKQIRARDNVPVLSWILLRGRCRDCGRLISWRYPVVELMTAILFVACYAVFGCTWACLRACVFCFLSLGLVFMDAETGLLPAEFTYPGIAVGLLFAWAVPVDSAATVFLLNVFGRRDMVTGAELSLLDAFLAIAFGGGFFYLAWAMYYLIRKREGMGFGDFAFIAMLGAFLGLKLTVLVVFLSPVLGTIYAGSLLLRLNAEALNDAECTSRAFLAREVPFGVFLGVSALFALFFGQAVWGWYLGLFR